MKVSAPQIGFDRFIPLEWVDMVLRVRAGKAQESEVVSLLATAGLGQEAAIKSRTKLNGLGLSPRAELVDFIDRGVHVFQAADTHDECATFAWGAALASYPFFGKVSEVIGRLTSLQGDCSIAEIHRRMSEQYGDRQVIKRATQAVIQTQSNWGAVDRVEGGRRLIRKRPIIISDEHQVTWLIEAALRYSNRAVSVSSLSAVPVLYPFKLDQPIGYLVSKSPNLEVMSEGVGSQFVRLQQQPGSVGGNSRS